MFRGAAGRRTRESAALAPSESGRPARHLRVVMELMRHSDLKLTMKIYTDVSQLPLAACVAALPSFEVGNSALVLSGGCTLKIVNS
jgi:integrase